jgi:hypothetical protein
VLFERQTVAAVREAVEHFELHQRAMAPAACRQNAARFSVERFNSEITQAFAQVLGLHIRH